MAIAAVGGANNNSAGANVTTLSVTYSPTAGDTVVLFFITNNTIAGLVVKDSAGNTLTQSTAIGFSGNFTCWYQNNSPAGITGYTATWTNAVNAGIAVEEYSGAAGGVNATNNATAAATSATASVADTIMQANNFIVAGMASGQTLTATVGTQRQQVTAGAARVTLQDNTSASVASVTNTATQPSSSAWACIAVELGGLGHDRANQDLQLVIRQPTSSKARVNQDVELVIRRGASHARVNQSLSLVVFRHGRVGQRVNQDIVLVVRKNPHGVIFQPNVCVCT
jgi:hypothetical protein